MAMKKKAKKVATKAKKAPAKAAPKKKAPAKAKAKPAKKAAPKAKVAAPKAAKKPAVKKVKSARKPNAAFMKPLSVSADLAAVVGEGPYPRTEVVKRMWVYIRKNGLQDAKNKRNINADDKLKVIFGGKKTVSMFEMAKHLSKHLK
jgi:upstream activation factor subunit UAF30